MAVFLCSKSSWKESLPYGKTTKVKGFAAGECPHSGILGHDLALGDQIQHRSFYLLQHFPLCMGTS